VTIILCYLLIPMYSYAGAIVVTSIAYLVMVSLSYFWGQRNYPIPYKVGKMLAFIAFGSILIAINYLVFHRNFWTGNLLLLLYLCVVVYSERAMLKKIVGGLTAK